MTDLLALAAGISVAAGVYLALSRELLRSVIGISLLGIAANLVIFGVGRPTGSAPPLVPPDQTALSPIAENPLSQALVLTAIVIGFALTCFSLVLVLAVKQRSGLSDGDALRAAEPRPSPEGELPIEGEG